LLRLREGLNKMTKNINKIYQSKGYKNRKEFIESLVEDIDIPLKKALNILDNKYFDELVLLLSHEIDEKVGKDK